MLDVRGYALGAEERELLQHPNVGGVILFARNYFDYAQLQALVSAMRQARAGLLIGVDHEGGRVQRLQSGFTHLPAARSLGQLAERQPAKARALAWQYGWLMAAELRAAAIDLSFAPVLDLDAGVSDVIGSRALHAEPAWVAELARQIINGMAAAGMAAVGKHFPGHGSVACDSHTHLPVDGRTYAEIAARDLVPFVRSVQAGIAAIMPAHVHYSAVTAQPAGFSRYWLQTVLRDRLGFTGAIVSDDLSMAGAASAGSLLQRTEAALAAGCDMVLLCNQPQATACVIEQLDVVATGRTRQRRHGLRGTELSAAARASRHAGREAAIAALQVLNNE